MQPRFVGQYRGIIVDVDDPDKRSRYRVHVYNIHRYLDTNGAPQLLTPERLFKMRDGGHSLDGGPPDDSPSSPKAEWNGYPWAEVVAHGGRHRGDIPYYEIGDLVWIEFECGNEEMPTITGTWLSEYAGFQDLNPERTSDYPDRRYKWMRTGRMGELLEMSGLPDEAWIRLQSWDAKLTAYRLDGSVRAEADSTNAMHGRCVSLVGWDQGVYAVGSSVWIQAAEVSFGVTPMTQGSGNGVGSIGTEAVVATLGLLSTWDAYLYAKNETMIGIYPTRYQEGNDLGGGADSAVSGYRTWQQGFKVTIAPRRVQIGGANYWTVSGWSSLWEVDTQVGVMNKTEAIDIEGAKYVHIHGGINLAESPGSVGGEPTITGASESGLVLTTTSSMEVYAAHSMNLGFIYDKDFLLGRLNDEWGKFKPEDGQHELPKAKPSYVQTRQIRVAPKYLILGTAGTAGTVDTTAPPTVRIKPQMPTLQVFLSSQDAMVLRVSGPPKDAVTDPYSMSNKPDGPWQGCMHAPGGNGETVSPGSMLLRAWGSIDICANQGVTFCGERPIWDIRYNDITHKLEKVRFPCTGDQTDDNWDTIVQFKECTGG